MTGTPLLRAVMECVPVAVAVVDDAGRVCDANPRWRALAALAGPSVDHDWRELVHPDDRALVPPPPGVAVEVRAVGAHGEPHWVSVTMAEAEPDGRRVVAVGDAGAARRAEAERAALHRIADAVTRDDGSPDLFSRVAEEVGRLVGADGAGVCEFTGGTTAPLVGRWSADADLTRRAPDVLPLEGDGTTARVHATGRPSRVDYAELARPGDALPHPWRTSVAAPIHVDGVLWGALGVVSVEAGRLADDAEERLARVAGLIGLAIGNTRARRALERQARTDPLTGLPHHGAFHEGLADEVVRARRYGHRLSIALVDVDHFKRVNDVHGHAAGDAALRAVALRMRELARVVDTTARLGGEEFAWLMPQTSVEGAHAAAERLRAALARRPAGPVTQLTVSIGVAQLEEGEDGPALMRRADRALYRAKHDGRDRTVAASAPSTMP